jgi:hypothetical protein
MTPTWKLFVLIVLLAATLLPAARADENPTDQRARLLLDSEIGGAGSLGFKFPATSFGPAVEIPIRDRFEFQSTALYSPSRKLITNDGNALDVSAAAIAFATSRVGIIAKMEHTSLWTSQFEENAWVPSAGAVVRNDYFGPGRLYVTYVFPTGCVWATSSNPCNIQSKRLQGMDIRQDARLGAHKRWGVDFGMYHFCDQSNQNEPAVGRRCHFGASAMITMSLEFHLGKPALSAIKDAAPDSF